MQSKSRPMDDISNLLTNAAGALKGVGDEVKAMRQSQAEKFVVDMDLVGREEFDVLKAMLQKSQADIAALTKEVKALKAQLKKTPPKKTPTKKTKAK